MATPVKSPAQKRAKADEGALAFDSDGEEDTGMPSGAQGEKRGRAPNKLDGPVTLDAFSKRLDTKFTERLDPVAASLDALLQDFGVFKIKMKDELGSMGLKLKSLESESSRTKSMLTQFEAELKSIKDNSKSEIAKMMRQITVAPQAACVESLVVVIGNVPGADSLEQAAEWVSKRCAETGVPRPYDQFIKAESYGGVHSAKCNSVSHRDALIASIFSSPRTAAAHPWAKSDQPFEKRSADGALLAFKKILVEWGFSKKSVRVDSGCLKVAGKEIVKATVVNYMLELSWCDGEWQQWQEMQTSPELVTLKGAVQEKLDKAKLAASGDSKGKGKGPA